MEISVAPSSKDDGVVVVHPVGEVDNRSAPELEAQLRKLVDQGRSRVVLDLSDVTYVNSAGIGVVAMSAKLARAAGGDVALAGLQGRVRRAFELVGLDRLVTITDSPQDACAAIADSPPEK